MPAEAPPSVEFFFDPSCPWTWMTSRWLVDAASARSVDIVWRSLSLGVVNAGREIPEQYRGGVEAGRAAHRVFAALRAEGRNDLVGEVYTEFGRRVHHDGQAPSVSLVQEIVEGAGAAAWAGAVDDDKWDAEVESSTKEAIELAGPDVGSPVLAFDDPRIAIFGPIVSPPPSGSEAATLFDSIVALARRPAFKELKRGRTQGPEFGPRP